MRRGKEFYTDKVEIAKKLYNDGMNIKDIAKKLNIIYSAAYHWIRGLRTPKMSRLEEFRNFIKEHGPLPVCDVEEKFPKHNDLYHLASSRGIRIMRLVLGKKMKGEKNYTIWYFLPGQEQEVKEKINKLLKNYKISKHIIKTLLENF